MDKKKILLHILICLMMCATVLSFRHLFIYPEAVVELSLAIQADITGIMDVLKLGKVISFLAELSPVVLLCFAGAICYTIGLGVLKIFSKKMQMCADIVSLNLVKVIKTGLVIYFMVMTLLLIFIYSVIGIPIAMGIFLIAVILAIFGNVPVAIYIGNSIQDILNGSDRRMDYNYIIGAIFMLLCISVYAVGCAFLLFVFPVLSLGTMGCMLEKNVLGIHLDAKKDEHKKDKFDRQKIKDIITDGL